MVLFSKFTCVNKAIFAIIINVRFSFSFKIQLCCKPKVAQLYVHVFVQKQIAKLKVSVDNLLICTIQLFVNILHLGEQNKKGSPTIHIFQCKGNLYGEILHFRLGKSLPYPKQIH